jgi:hypothetical protein
MSVSVAAAFTVSRAGCAGNTLHPAGEKILNQSCRINRWKTCYHLDAGSLEDSNGPAAYSTTQQMGHGVIIEPAGKYPGLMGRWYLKGG